MGFGNDTNIKKTARKFRLKPLRYDGLREQHHEFTRRSFLFGILTTK